MTRGQDSLMMDLETPAESAAATARVDVSKLVVLRASAEELKAHEKYLDGLAKEAGGNVLWRKT
jgi:DNA polymerase-3 subunit epsilon